MKQFANWFLGRNQLTISQLLELTANGMQDTDKRIEKAFDWHHARRLELAKWMLSLALGLLAGLVASFARGPYEFGPTYLANPEYNVEWWLVWLGLGFFGAAIAGLYAVDQLQGVNAEYFASLKLVNRLGKVRPLLKD